MYLTSKISAENYATLCYFANVGGMGPRVKEQSMPPGRQAGKYSVFVKKQFEFVRRSQAHYCFSVPGHSRHEVSRLRQPLLVVPPHEILDAFVSEQPDIVAKLDNAIAKHEVPPNYFTNPIVQSSADRPLPLGLYLDAAPYSLTDSCVGIWVQDLITNRRWIMALVRKRICCQCGCRGRCTFQPILDWLKHSLRACADRRWPTRRHDLEPWQHPQDSIREAKAGQPLAIRGVVLQLRGDWAEFQQRLGFPSWASNMRPCLACAADPSGLYRISECSVVSLPWRLNSHQDIDQACSRCEIKVSIDELSMRRLSNLLRYDKRTSSNAKLGRCLVQDVVEFGLLAGDRLEYSDVLSDVGLLESLDFDAQEKYEVVFWRRSRETACLFRCPLWDERIGLTADNVLCIDLLHTFHLGVLLVYVRCAIWKLLEAGAWPAREGTAAERYRNSVLQLRNELFNWYTRFRDKTLTRLAYLTPAMLGAPSNRLLKIKAAETYGLLIFVLDVLHTYRPCLNPDVFSGLLAAGKALKSYRDICHEQPMVLPPAKLQDAN